jgi:1-acyl-sn-glycerol-3-phosphate acyltransferase
MIESDQSQPIAGVRRALLTQTLAFLGDRDPAQKEAFEERIAAVIAEADDSTILQTVERVRTTGGTWGYHPPDPFARRVHFEMADAVIDPRSGLRNAELLAIAGDRSCVFVANHLSYADANMFEVLLTRSGLDPIAKRLTVFAGPKVYLDPARRFSSLCFGTIKTPQSPSRASEEARMPAREVARLARQTIDVALQRLRAEDHLLIFVEGTRSRSGSMQRALPAVSRYLEDSDSLIVPVGIAGTEALVPVDIELLYPTCVTVTLGKPIEPSSLRRKTRQNRTLALDVVGLLIAGLLPPAYRGTYGDDAPGLDEARLIAGAFP